MYCFILAEGESRMARHSMDVFFERRMERASAWEVSRSPLEQMRMCSFCGCGGVGRALELAPPRMEVVSCSDLCGEVCRGSEVCEGGDSAGGGVWQGVGGCDCEVCFEFSWEMISDMSDGSAECRPISVVFVLLIKVPGATLFQMVGWSCAAGVWSSFECGELSVYEMLLV